MKKDFAKWLAIKESLDSSTQEPPYFNEGEVWWCCVGINIGSEINGKDSTYVRPVVILKKLSRDSFVGIPMTSKMKVGSWYIPIIFGGKISNANLAQIKTFNYRRLRDKYGQLENFAYLSLKIGLKNLLEL